MKPSSRTPEGSPSRCPICGKSSCMEPSSFPTHDAPCPHCGHLLWFADPSADLPGSAPAHDFATGRPHLANRSRPAPTPQYEHQPFSAFERAEWAIIAVLSTIIVSLNEGLTLTTGFWLVGVTAFGQLALPSIIRRAHGFVNRSENLYLGVVCGWGLVPGPIVGVLFGVLLPLIYDCGLASFWGGLIGLVAGPCFAVAQGLILVSVVDLTVWIATGTGLSKRAS